MPGRTYAVGGAKYKYGFNGKEKDDEWLEGQYDFDERMYDARLGRFFSTDPDEEDYPGLSPYCFAANNPILFVDNEGRSPDGNPWLEVLSVALDFVPGVGTVKNLIEAAVGYDMAGNHLENWERVAMLIPGGAILATSTKISKAIVKQVIKHADDIARVAKKVFTKVVAKSKKIEEKIDNILNISDNVIEKINRKKLNPPKKPGEAPTFKHDGTPVELHHVEGTHNGPIKEMHWFDHRGKGNYSKNHPRDKFKKSQIDRDKFKLEREKYWAKQYKKHFAKLERKKMRKERFSKFKNKMRKTFTKKRYGRVTRIRSKF